MSSATEVALGSIATSLQEIVLHLKNIEANTQADSEAGTVMYKREADGKKVIVFIRISIISVGDIDTIKQEFSVDFWMSARWKEPMIKGRKEEEIDWSSEWSPRIVFFNSVSMDSMVIKHYLHVIPGDDDPFVMKSFRIKGIFKENLELYDFPVDYQALTIQLMSDWKYEQVEFQKDLSRHDTVRKDTFTGKQEWYLQKYVNSVPSHTNKEEGGSPHIYALYHMSCFVKRKHAFYIWNVLLIMFLIELLSFSSFGVPSDEPADRLSVNLTLLLTAVAFKFAVSQILPIISYLTLLDKYVLASLLFLFAVSCENGVAGALHTFGSPHAEIVDIISIYATFAVFVIVNTFKIIYFFVMAGKATKELSKQTQNHEMMCQAVDRFTKQAAYKQKETEAEAGNDKEENTDIEMEQKSGLVPILRDLISLNTNFSKVTPNCDLKPTQNEN